MKNFPAVCVRGSAGGPDAYIRMLQNLPTDMIISLLDPPSHSALAKLACQRLLEGGI